MTERHLLYTTHLVKYHSTKILAFDLLDLIKTCAVSLRIVPNSTKKLTAFSWRQKLALFSVDKNAELKKLCI